MGHGREEQCVVLGQLVGKVGGKGDDLKPVMGVLVTDSKIAGVYTVCNFEIL